MVATALPATFEPGLTDAKPIYLVDQFGNPISSTGQPLPVSLTHGNVVSTANSTTALLSGNGVFTGGWESSLPYSAVSVQVFANVASAANGLSIQQSQDGTNADITDTYNVAASVGFATIVNLVGAYFRIVYTNGAGAQGTFRLQTVKQAVEVVQPRSLTPAGLLPVALARANVSIPTGAGNTVVKASPGLLCTIVVTTAGTTSATFYDNPSTNSGTALYVTPATTNLGDIKNIYGPANTGITVANTASGPVMTVYFA